VPTNKSIKPDYIVCLEDGKRLKMLKRHLRTSYDLSPKEYRQKWGLPDDYPMVAPKYAAQRSELAKKFGLGNAAKRRRRGRKKAAA
jgi:predicted transcriptional regulator